MTEKMTKAERAELGQLIRKRERVMKAAAAERSAQMMAEFDAQCAAIYSYDDDAVWKAATEAAHAVVLQAQVQVAERCRELGIPPEFAPNLSFHWYGRGQNAVSSRRTELRRMAKSRVEQIELETRTHIERLSLAAQTEVISQGLQSTAATEFLEKMPAVDDLMPSLKVPDVTALLDNKRKGQTAYLSDYSGSA